MIKGGITTHDDHNVELTIAIGGGKSCRKSYNDVVNTAIDRFIVVGSAIVKTLKDVSSEDHYFCVEQLKRLFEHAHVEFIRGNHPFQKKYNMWMIDGYIRMLLQTADLKLVAELLEIDRILYSIEEISRFEGEPLEIDFQVPTNLKVIHVANIPARSELGGGDELCDSLRSIGLSLPLLLEMLESNRANLAKIYDIVVKTAAEHLA